MIKEKIFGPSSGKASKPKTKQNYNKTSWKKCQCSGSSQIPSKKNLDDYHRFLSLYKIVRNYSIYELHIYDTESYEVKVKNVDTIFGLDEYTCITQLPNGELFCYGGYGLGTTLIIDRSYGTRMLPSGTPCLDSSVLYFDNNIYCFGGKSMALSRKFDLKKNKWTNLTMLPWAENRCHSVIFNRNILVSGWGSLNLWLYSIEINSFSILPYNFASNAVKLLINVERLYLIEWGGKNKLIYEGEDEYNWKQISKTPCFPCDNPSYCLYNKEKIYITAGDFYYWFDLKKKVVFKALKIETDNNYMAIKLH